MKFNQKKKTLVMVGKDGDDTSEYARCQVINGMSDDPIERTVREILIEVVAKHVPSINSCEAMTTKEILWFRWYHGPFHPCIYALVRVNVKGSAFIEQKNNIKGLYYVTIISKSPIKSQGRGSDFSIEKLSEQLIKIGETDHIPSWEEKDI